MTTQVFPTASGVVIRAEGREIALDRVEDSVCVSITMKGTPGVILNAIVSSTDWAHATALLDERLKR